MSSAVAPSGPAAGSSVVSSSVGAGQFTNPVYPDDFPDPSVIAVDGTFHAFGTQGGGDNVQTLTSPDLVQWTKGEDALPQVGAWASAGSTWAPEVIAVEGRYVMFYVARDTASDRQCIGRAESAGPAGPFTDHATSPFVCQPELGGSIDPNPVLDSDGKLYLYWKNDGNCCQQKVQLWAGRLSRDATAVDGAPTPLLTNTKAWQGDLIEAPEVLEHGATHLLFYSANTYASQAYAIGYATCTGPLGPCTDASDRPLLASNPVAAGPGHCFPITLPDGSTWLLYHAWRPDALGTTYPGRQLWLDPLHWNGSTPTATGPDAGRQPVPKVGR
jgi:beta-xylosidase